MWWKVIVEVLIVVAIMMAGSSFWACVKSRGHLGRLLGDVTELQGLIDYIGPSKIAQESSGIEPVFGSYAANIATFERIHLAALRQTATQLLIGIVVLLVLSLFLGVYFFAVSVAIFLLVSIGDIPASARNSNATHVHTLISNIYKWNHTDSDACRSYCTRGRPSLMHLYGLVAQLPTTV
jgi:hypothetical protein